MNAELIFEALSYVDEDLLLASENVHSETTDETVERSDIKMAEATNAGADDPAVRKKRAKRIARRIWIPLSACACLALILALPLGKFMFNRMGSSDSASMSSVEESYDTASDAAMDSAGETFDSADTNDALAETEELWIMVNGITYEELSEEELSDYGLAETDLKSITEDDLGTDMGTVEDAWDPDLIGCRLYQLKTNGDIFLLESPNGYLCFRQVD